MNQTVDTVWYLKKCALGTLVFLVLELLLLMLAALLLQSEVVGEEKMALLVFGAAATASFVGCATAGRKSSRRRVLIPTCAAASWLVEQVLGVLFYGELIAARSLQMATATLIGMLSALMLGSRKKKRRSGWHTRR